MIDDPLLMERKIATAAEIDIHFSFVLTIDHRHVFIALFIIFEIICQQLNHMPTYRLPYSSPLNSTGLEYQSLANR